MKHLYYYCWATHHYIRVPEGPLLKMPHTDGGETSGKYRNFSPRSSSPVSKNIIHNTGRESLNQFITTAIVKYTHC